MEDSEREKKLLAGKQKLAAYRKKKKKAKKSQTTEGTDSEVTESEASSVIDLTDIASLSDVSDSSSDPFVAEKEEFSISPRAMDTARRELIRSHERITQLEETLLGKEALLGSLVEENEDLKKQLTGAKTGGAQVTDAGLESEMKTPDMDSSLQTVAECHKKIQECQLVIQQRDEVIRQLSDNLKATTENRDTLQAEYQAQAEQLASQVHLLQEQLRQTGDWLHQHSGEQGISAQALLEAKNELLALQQVNKEKDSQIIQLQGAMQERDQTITHLVEKFNSSAENFEKMKKAYIHLQQEAMILKQEKSSNNGGKLQLELAALKKSYNETLQQLSQTTDLQANSEAAQRQIESLKTKNEKLVKKDKESGQVIKHIMGNMEKLQKGQLPSSPVSPSPSTSSVSSDIDLELSTLRAELEESHGEQIVHIKEQLQEKHKIEVDRLNRELGTVKGERDKLNTQVTEWQKMYMSLSQTGASGADLSMEIHALRTENSMYKDHINDLSSEIERLKQEKEDIKKDIQTSSSSASTGVDISHWRSQCTEYSKQVEELNKEVQSLHSERSTVLKELQDAQTGLTQLDTLHGKIKTYESMVASLEENLSDVKKEREESVSEINRLKLVLTTVQDKTNLLVGELEHAQDSTDKIQLELQTTKAKLQETENLLAAEQKEHNQTMTCYSETENELLKTRALKLNLESELENAKLELQKVNEAHRQEMQVVQNQFEMRLKMDNEETNIELQKVKLEVESLRTTQSSDSNVVSSSEQLQTKFQAEIDRVKKEYTQYIQQIQATYESQFKSTHEQWQAAHESQIKSVQEQLKNAHQAQLVELQEQLNRAAEKQLTDIKTNYELQIEKLVADGKVKTQELEEKMQKSEAEHKMLVEDIVKELTEKHHKEILFLQKQHEDSVLDKVDETPSMFHSKCDTESDIPIDGDHSKVVTDSPEASSKSESNSHHYHTTHIIHSKTVQSSRVVKTRTFVKERLGETIGQQGGESTSMDEGTVALIPNTNTESYQSDNIHYPVAGLDHTYNDKDSSNLEVLQRKVCDLENIIGQIKRENQRLKMQLKDTTPEDVHVKSVQSDTFKQQSKGNEEYLPHTVKFSSASVSSDYDELYTSAMDQTVNLSATSDSYMSASEASLLVERSASSDNVEDRLKRSEQEKQQLIQEVKKLQESLALVEERCSQFEMKNTQLQDTNVDLLADEAAGETISELRDQINTITTEKTALETVIFYKDLEINKLSTEQENTVENLLDSNVIEVKFDKQDKCVKENVNQMAGNNDEKGEQSSELELLKSSNEAFKKQVLSQEAKIEELNIQIDAQQADYDRLKMEKAEEDFEIERLIAETKLLNKESQGSIQNVAELQHLKEQITLLEGEKEDLNTTIDELEIDIGELKVNIECKDDEIKELQKEVVGSETIEKEVTANVTSSTNDESTQKKDLPEAIIVTDILASSIKNNEIQDKTDTDATDYIGLKWELDKTQKEKTDLDIRCEKLEEYNSGLNREIEALKTEYEELKTQYTELNDCFVENQKLIDTQTIEADTCMTDLTNKISHLEMKNEDLENQLDRVKIDSRELLTADVTDSSTQAKDGSVEAESFMTDRLNDLEAVNVELTEKLKHMESEHIEELQLAETKVTQLGEQIKQLEILRIDLEGKLNVVENEKTELKKEFNQLQCKEEEMKQKLSIVQTSESVNVQLTEEVDTLKSRESDMKEKLCLAEASQKDLLEKINESERQQSEMIEKKNQSLTDLEEKLTENEKNKAELFEKLELDTADVQKKLKQSILNESELRETLNIAESRCVEYTEKLKTLEINFKEVDTKVCELENEKQETAEKVKHDEEIISALTVQCAELRQDKKDLEEQLSSLEIDTNRQKSEKEEHDNLHQQQFQSMKDDHNKVLGHYQSLIESLTSEKGNFTAEFEQMREMLDEKQSLMNDMQEEIASLRLSNESLVLEQEKEVERLMNQKNELESERVGAITKLDEVQREVISVQQAIHDLQGENKELYEKIDERKTENDTLVQQISTVESRTSELEQENTVFKNDIDEKTKRIEAYNKCSTEINEERESLQKDLSEKQATIVSLQTESNTLHNSLGELKNVIEEKDKIVEEKRATVNELQESCEVMQQQLKEKESTISSLQDETSNLQENNKKLNAKVEEHTRIVTETLEKVENLTHLLEDKENTICSIRQFKIKLENSLQEEKQRANTLLSQKQEINDKFEKSVEQVKVLQAEVLALQTEQKSFKESEETNRNKAESLQSQVENLKGLNAKLLERIKATQGDVKEATSKSDTVNSENEQLKNNVLKLESEIVDLQSVNQELNDKVEISSKKVDDLEKHCNDLNLQVDKLEQVRGHLSNELELLKSRLDTVQEKCTSESSMVKSLEEANLLLTSRNQDLLKSIRDDREKHQHEVHKVVSEKEILGEQLRCLKTDHDSLDNVVKEIKAENQALKFSSTEIQTESKLQCEQLQQKTNSKENENVQLQESLKRSQKEKDDIHNKYNETVKTVNDLESRIQSLTENLKQTVDVKLEVEEKVSKLTEEYKKSLQDSTNLKAQNRQLQQSIESLESQLQQSNTTIESLQHDSGEKGSVIEKLKEEKDFLNNELKEITKEHTEVKSEKEALIVQLDSISKENSVKEEEVQNLRVQVKESNDDVKRLTDSENQLSKTIQGLETEVTQAKEECNQVHSIKEQVEKDNKELHVKISELSANKEAEINELKKKQAKVEAELEKMTVLQDEMESTITDMRKNNENLISENQSLLNEKVLLTDQVTKLNVQVSDISDDCKKYVDESESLNNENQTLKCQVEELQAHISKRNSEYESLHATKSEFEQQILSDKKDLQQKLDAALSEKATLQNNVKSLMNEVETMEIDIKNEKETNLQKINEYVEKCETLNTTNTTLQGEKQQLIDSVNRLQTEYENLCRQIDDKNVHNEKQKEQIEIMKCNMEEIQNDKDELTQNNIAVNKEISEIKMLLDELKKEKVEQDEKLSTVSQEKDKFQQMTKDLENDLEVVKTEFNSEKQSLSDEIHNLKNEVQSVLHEKETLNETILNLSEQKSTKEAENGRLKKEVTKAQENKASMESEMNSLQESLDRLLQEHELTSNDHDEMSLKNKSLHEEIKNLHSRIEVLDNDNSRLQDELRRKQEEENQLSSSVNNYQKDAENMTEKVSQLTEKVETLNSEMDLMRSENLSLQTEKDQNKEHNDAVIARLTEQVRSITEEKDSLEGEVSNLTEQFKSLHKTHSDAIGEFQKQIKNLYNLAERLEKENKRLQDRVVESVNESDTLREKLEGIQSEYHMINDQFDEKISELQNRQRDTDQLRSKLNEMEAENDALKIKIEDTDTELNAKMKKLVKENTVLRDKTNEESASSISDKESAKLVNSKVESVEVQHSESGTGSTGQISALQNEVKKYQEERQLMEASIENVKYERDRLKEQVDELEKSIKDSSDGEYVNVSVRYEQEITTLKRSLDTVMNEREAMKETFEEDLSRLSKQVEEKENERNQLEHEVEELKSHSDSGVFHSTPRMADGEKINITSDASHIQPVPFSGVGAGIMSDSMQFEATDLQMLQNVETVDKQQEVAANDKQNLAMEKLAVPGFGGFGIFSDSCQLSSSDLELAKPLDLEVKPETPKKVERLSSKPAVCVDGSVREVIDRYEQKIAEMQEQHEVELKVTEYNLSEAHNLKLRQIKTTIEFELEEEYKQKSEELNSQLEQKLKNIKKEQQTNFVAELRKARQEIGRSESRDEDQSEDAALMRSDSQVTDEIVVLRRKLERLEEAKIELLDSIDGYNNREAGLQEEILALTLAKDHMADENIKLAKSLSFYTDHGTLESTSEFNTEEWRVRYDSELKHRDTSSPKAVDQQQQESKLNDIGDGSLPTSQEIEPNTIPNTLNLHEEGLQLDSGDQDELRNQLDFLQNENESLKLKLRNQSLGINESIREEMMDLESKYQMILQEKESLLRHFHRMGIDPSALSVEVEPETRRRSQSHDTDITEDSLNQDSAPRDNFEEEDFIDWKLKYEVVEKENELLKSKLDSSLMEGADSPQRMMEPPSLNTTPQFVISTGEFKSRHSALVEQNEMLRAHLGSRGLYIDRSLEGDTLDMHFQLETLANENEKLKQHLEDYDKGELSTEMLQVPSSALSTGHKSPTSSEYNDVNWRYMFESLCKEHEEAKCELARLKSSTPNLGRVAEDDSLTSELRSAIEDDSSLTKSQYVEPPTVAQVTDSQKYKETETELENLKCELKSAKDKAKKDLTKMKAKCVVANRENEKLKKKLQSYESQESVVSVASAASDSSSTAEDSGFVVVDTDKDSQGETTRTTIEDVSQTTSVSSQHTVETLVKESVTEVHTSKSSHTTVVTQQDSTSDGQNSTIDNLQQQLSIMEREMNKVRESHDILSKEREELKIKVQSLEQVKPGPSKGKKQPKDLSAKHVALKQEMLELQKTHTVLKKENEELKSKFTALQKEKTKKAGSTQEQEDLFNSMIKENKNIKAQLTDKQEQYSTLQKECEELKTQQIHNKEWHEAEMHGLQDKCELLSGEKKNLLQRIEILDQEKEEVKRNLDHELSESLKQITEFKSQVSVIQNEKQMSCDKLLQIEEKLKITETTKDQLEHEIERYSVSEQKMQVKHNEVELENSSLKKQLSMLKSSVDQLSSVSELNIDKSHDNVLVCNVSSSESSTVCIPPSSSVCNQSMELHGSVVQGSALVQGEGIYTSSSFSSTGTLNKTNTTHTITQTDISLKQDQSLQVTSPNINVNSVQQIEKVDKIISQVGFQPIVDDKIDTMSSQVKSYDELILEVEDLQQQYESVISQNSDLMHQLEDLENELSDTKYKLSLLETDRSGHTIVNSVDSHNVKGVGGDLILPQIEGDFKGDDNSFYMSDAVRVSSMEELGEDNDDGRVVDIQTVPPTGVQQSVTFSEEKSKSPSKEPKKSPTKGTKTFVSSHSSKISTTPTRSEVTSRGIKSGKVKDIRQDSKSQKVSPRTEKSKSKVTKVISETNLSNEALKKERDRLTRENGQLSDKLKQISKTSTELNSLKVKYDRLNKEKKELQIKYDKDVIKTSGPRKRSDGDEVKKMKQEKVKLEKELISVRNQVSGKERENQELRNMIYQKGYTSDDINLTQLRIQYEILLVEKEQMCNQFEEEKNRLLESMEEMQCNADLSELEAVEFEVSVHDEMDPATTEAINKMKLKLRELTSQNNALQQEKDSTEEQLLKLKDEKTNVCVNTQRDKIDLQQRINDLNAKIEFMELEDSDLRSQLHLAKIEKTEIKSELEEHLKQVETQNTEQLTVSQSRAISGGTHNFVTHDQKDFLSPLSVQIPIVNSQYTQMPSGSSASSSRLPIELNSPAASGTSFDLENESLNMSELKLQYEILLEEKREICVKLQEKDDLIKDLKSKAMDTNRNFNDSQSLNESMRTEFESQKIQYEMVIDEKNELCLNLEKERSKVTDLKEKVKVITEQLLESQREGQSLRSRNEMLKREMSHESLDQECFETEDEMLAKKKKKELEEKISELTLHLEKVEQDLDINKHKLSEAHEKVEASDIEKRGSLAKLENELHCERQRLHSVNDELEEFKFKYDEMEAQVETVQQENDDLSKQLDHMKQTQEKQTEFIAKLKEQVENLESRNKNLTCENEQLKLALRDREKEVADKMFELQEALDDCLSGKQKLWSEINELKSQLEEKDQPNEDESNQKEEKSSTESEGQKEVLNKLREAKALLEKDYADVVSQLNSTTELNVKLQSERDLLEKALITLQNHAKDVNDKIIAIHTEYEKLQEDRQCTNDTVATLKQELKHLEEKATVLTKEKCDVLKEKETFEIQNKNLQEQLDNIEKSKLQIEQVNKELNTMKDNQTVQIETLKMHVTKLDKEKSVLFQQKSNTEIEKALVTEQVKALEEKLASFTVLQGEHEKLQLMFDSNEKQRKNLNEVVSKNTELECQIQSLKEDVHTKNLQVQKLQEEYQKESQELKALLESNDKFKLQLRKLEDDKTSSSREVVDAKGQVEMLQLENRKLSEKCSMFENESKRDTLDLEKQLIELKYLVEIKIRESKEVNEKHVQVESELRLTKETLTDLENKNSELVSMKTEFERMNSKYLEKVEQYENVISKHSQLEKDACSLRSELKNSLLEKDNIAEENQQLEEENKSRISQIDVLLSNNEMLEKQLGNLQQTLEETKVEKSSSEISLKEIKEELNRIQIDYDLVNKEKESLKHLATDANIQVSELERQIYNMQKQVQEGKAEIEKQLKEINELKSEKMFKEEKAIDCRVVSDNLLVHPSEEMINIQANESLCVNCQQQECKYNSLLEEYEVLKQKYNRTSVPPDVNETGEDTVDIGADLNLSDLQEENAQLFKQKNDLENELMNVRGDKNDLAVKLEKATLNYKQELEQFKEKLGDYQLLCDTVSTAKDKLEQELQRQRNEYEGNLSKVRLEKLEENIKDKDKLDDIVQQIADSERQCSELRDDLRTVEEEKGLLQLKVAHLMRECKLYERHIKDLEREVEMQMTQIQEATHEHKETIRMLAELRLEQEMSKKEQKGEFSRIEGKLKKLETEISTNKSTPVSMSVISAPSQLARSSQADSVCSYTEDTRSDLVGGTEGERALSIKHFQMIEELNRIHRDLQESQENGETLARENKSLRDTLEREKKKYFVTENEDVSLCALIDSQKVKSRHSSGTPKNTSRRSSFDCSDIPAEMLYLKERVIVLQANNKKLVHENEMLRSQLLNQEALFEELQKKVRMGKESDVERILTQQIDLLKQQREQLLQKIEELKYTSVKYNDMLDEKSKLEDCLRREKELVRQRTHDKDRLEIELLRERLTLEKQFREQHRLEELIKHKNLLEKELYRQKESLEGELDLAEYKLKGVTPLKNQKNSSVDEESIQAEMGKLSTEISQNIKQTQVTPSTSSPVLPKYRSSYHTDTGRYHSRSGASSLSSHKHIRQSSTNSNTSVVSSGSGKTLKLDCGCVAELDTMKMFAQCQYHIAVEKLRTDLRRIDSQRKVRRK